MKKILLSTVALAGLTAGAMAADLPARRIAPVAPAFAAVPVFTWTGFYVGVNAGYGFSNRNSNDVTTVNPYVFNNAVFAGGTIQNSNNNNNDGFVGGGQIGYNYQFGTFVVGVEADIQYVDLGRNRDNAYFVQGGFPAGFRPVADVTNLDYFGTVRGRLGFTGLFDRAMIYATGGFAYAGGSRNNDSGYTFTDNRNNDRTGYAIGGGLEYAFTNNITAKIEGLYVNLDNNDDNRNNGNLRTIGFAGNGQPVTAVTNGNRSRDTDFAVVRAGLNFKFNTF